MTEQRVGDSGRRIEIPRRSTGHRTSSTPVLTGRPARSASPYGSSARFARVQAPADVAAARARAAAAEAARRRVRILAGLLAASALSWAGLAVGLLPAWLGLFNTTLLAAYVVLLRITAVARERQASRPVVYVEDTPTRSLPARRPQVDPSSITLGDIRREPVVDSSTIVAMSAYDIEAEEGSSVDAAATTEAAEGTWSPVPVPPPVYTMKPIVPRKDLEARKPAVAPAPEPTVEEEDLAPLDLDAVFQRRRAVGS